jgi:16S rRNA (cytosine1402-N4)-methyltransferase
MSSAGHIPVLAREVVAALKLPHDGFLVDATIGRGGHCRLCLDQLGPGGHILAIDRDPEAVRFGRALFAGETRITVVQGRFSELAGLVARHAPDARVDAVLLDLGVSSPQLDTAARGFSFTATGPIDMRMDPESGRCAADWLAEATEAEIARVIHALGEERFARRIAAAIKRALADGALATTGDLAALVSRAVPTRERNKHPATRTFQAIRMHVNDELGELARVLPQALDVLDTGGRLVVISFHSLEDRMVKRFMRDQARGDRFPPDMPVTADMLEPRLALVGKAVRADESEVAVNPRARSAVLRVAEKLA